ncbi:hypothetical protein Tco_0738517 [Tanacetum coccineum]
MDEPMVDSKSDEEETDDEDDDGDVVDEPKPSTYDVGVLTRKMEEVSDIEATNSIAIGETHPRVTALEEQVQTLQTALHESRSKNQQWQTTVAEMHSREGTLMQYMMWMEERLTVLEKRLPGPPPRVVIFLPFLPFTKPACRIMPPKQMSQAAIAKLVSDEVAKALAADRATRNATSAGGPGNVEGEGNARGPKRAQQARDCTFSSFMKCGPTQFHGKEGAIELCRWFEKIKSTFRISECVERNKVKFAVATLQGRSLTWWNTQVATLGLAEVNRKS